MRTHGSPVSRIRCTLSGAVCAAIVSLAAGAAAPAQPSCGAQSLIGPDFEQLFNPQFGSAIAADGDTIVIGAPSWDADGVLSSGAAYVYRWTGSAWEYEAMLTAPEPKQREHFGWSVSVSGDTIIVGKPSDDVVARVGAADVFVRVNGAWVHQAELNMPVAPAIGDKFGHAVSVSGDVAAVSAVDDWRPNGIGSVHVFRRTNGAWSVEKWLFPPDGWTQTGAVLEIEGDTLAVGAPYVGGSEGYVHIFRRIATGWTTEATIAAPNPDFEWSFGMSLSLDGDTLVVGALDEGTKSETAGGVRVYTREAGVWSFDQLVTPSALDPLADQIGHEVEIEGDLLTINRRGRRIEENIDRYGATDVFQRIGGVWQEQYTIDHGEASIEPHEEALTWGAYAVLSGGRLIAAIDTYSNGQVDVMAGLLGCTGDLNADCAVDGADLGLLLGAWGGPGPTDLTGDGNTDGADLGLLLGAWGACP